MTETTYDWDTTVEKPDEDGAFVLLPAGLYSFQIAKFERARHEPKPDGKLPECPKAILYVKIDGGDRGEIIVKHNLFLHSTCEGFLCSFFSSQYMDIINK